MMKLCSKCAAPMTKGKRRWHCRPCHAAYVQARRKPYSQQTPEERRRRKAREKANLYQRRGYLIPQPCEVCGSELNIEKHHRDYSKPLEVRWLCRLHHKELHLTEAESEAAA